MKSIITTVQNLLTKNILLKIVALVLAMIIWIAVVNVNDPTKTVTIYNVPIKVTDGDVITDNEQVFTVQDRLFVNVTVSGRRSTVSSLTSSSFHAVASMKELSVANTIPVSISVNRNFENKITINNQSVSNVSVFIEDLETRSYEVQTNILGEVSQNYLLGDVTLGKDRISVTAPVSVHKKIAQVRVDVDVNNASGDFKKTCNVKLFNSEGQRIKISDDIVLSQNKIRADIKVLKLKEIPLVVEIEGEPSNGYEITGHSIEPEKIIIAGPADIVDGINEMTINDENTNVDGITESRDVTLNLVKYLEPGVTIRGDGVANLKIDVEGDVYDSYSYAPKDIQIKNLPEQYEARITTNKAAITVFGKERYFKNVTKESFAPSIDLSNVSEGTFMADLNVVMPEGLKLLEDSQIRVIITKKDDKTKSESEPQTGAQTKSEGNNSGNADKSN